MNKEVDYIVVGLGIAGISFCERVLSSGKSLMVIDKGIKGATYQSGGIFNPTVLKRFNIAWNASLFYPLAVEFYKNLSDKLGFEIYKDTPILRILNNVAEQNDWVAASGKIGLQQFLQSDIEPNTNPNISAPFGVGRVLGTARINKGPLLEKYRCLLKRKDRLIDEEIDYTKLRVESGKVDYRGISAKRIVFCEGVGAIKNPWFPDEALIPNRGEYVVIKAEALQLKEILKGPMFVIPLGEDRYKVGATYARNQSDTVLTTDAKKEILSKLNRMISCPYEVIDHTVGVRPTTRDRKPLLGYPDKNQNVVFFNGLGTRGLLMAPYLSQVLYDYLEEGTPLPAGVDIRRTIGSC